MFTSTSHNQEEMMGATEKTRQQDTARERQCEGAREEQTWEGGGREGGRDGGKEGGKPRNP